MRRCSLSFSHGCLWRICCIQVVAAYKEYNNGTDLLEAEQVSFSLELQHFSLSKAEPAVWSATLLTHTSTHTHTWAHKHTQSLELSALSLSLACSLPNVHSFPLPIAQRLFHFVALSLSLPLPLSLTLSVARCLCCSVVAREIVKSSKSGGFYSLVFVRRLAFLFCLSNRAVVRTFKLFKKKPLNLIKSRLGNVFVFQKFPSTGRRRIYI